MNEKSGNEYLVDCAESSKFLVSNSMLSSIRKVVLLCKRELYGVHRLNILITGPIGNCLFKYLEHEVVILVFENPLVDSQESILILREYAMEAGFDLCFVKRGLEKFVEEIDDFYTMSYRLNMDFQESCGSLGKFAYNYIGRNSALMYRLLMEPSKSWRHTYYEMKLLGGACKDFQEEDFNRGLTYILENSIKTSSTMQKTAPVPEESFVKEAEAHYQQLAERADAILTDRKSMDWSEIFEKYETT